MVARTNGAGWGAWGQTPIKTKEALNNPPHKAARV